MDRPPFLHPILDLYGAPALLALVAGLAIAQERRPLRRWVRPLKRRLATNLKVAVPGFLVLRLLLIPAAVAAAGWSEANGFGLLYLVSLPGWLHGVLAFLLLDHQLYVWHWLNHRIPLLWRFHNVHHIDADLGLSTAVRFHFGELALSALYRAAAVIAIGAPVEAVLAYEVVFQGSVAFHHSNVRLPFRLERALSRVIVTPRMHGIHHSIVRRETDSNYSNLFNVWDRLHRTIRLDVPQDALTIGVPAYPVDDDDTTWWRLLTLPFRRQRDDWQAPDGARPDRPATGDAARLQR